MTTSDTSAGTDIFCPRQLDKDELIEKATARLRRRLLEERLSDVMRQVIDMQGQLEFLRVDAAATIDAVMKMDDDLEESTSPCRLDSLERRLHLHQQQLDQLKMIYINKQRQQQQQSSQEEQQQQQLPTRPSLASLSTFSLSSVSSLFSECGRRGGESKATSVDEQDDDCSSTVSGMTLAEIQEEQRRFRRRRRVKQHRQKYYQERLTEEDPWFYFTTEWRRNKEGNDDVGNQVEEPVPAPDNNNLASAQHHYRPVNIVNTGAIYDDGILSDIGPMSTTTSSMLSGPVGLQDIITQRHPLSPIIIPLEYQQEQRNVLDDTLSFLDSLSENADDGGFGEDIDFLLRHPDLCCRPLSEVMTEIRRPPPPPEAWIAAYHFLRLCFSPTLLLQCLSNLIYAGGAYCWRWCRFLMILSAATTISLLRGPQDILDA